MSEQLKLSAYLQIKPFAEGRCPASVQELLEHIQEQGRMVIQYRGLLGYNYGNETPGSDDRGFPWFRMDKQDRFLGVFVWSTQAQSWVRGGVVGELKTIVRVQETLTDDLKREGLEAGWVLADGTNAGIPDLTGNSAFFTGTAPDYDIYTLAYTGGQQSA